MSCGRLPQPIAPTASDPSTRAERFQADLSPLREPWQPVHPEGGTYFAASQGVRRGHNDGGECVRQSRIGPLKPLPGQMRRCLEAGPTSWEYTEWGTSTDSTSAGSHEKGSQNLVALRRRSLQWPSADVPSIGVFVRFYTNNALCLGHALRIGDGSAYVQLVSYAWERSKDGSDMQVHIIQRWLLLWISPSVSKHKT